MLTSYFSLTKPKMIRGNAIIALAGFLFASQGKFDLTLFLAMFVGLAFVIGSGCVLNNVIDRNIDAKMNRTKDRAIVKGRVSARNAIIYGIILGIFGLVVFFFYTNTITTSIAAFGAFVYVGLYSPLKHHTHYAAVIGTLSGATPIIIGYTSLTGRIDTAAIILFIIMVIWQLPHFYAIALYRFNDYKAANVPVLPVSQGIECTKLHIAVYIPLFIIAVLTLTFLGYTGKIFAGIMLISGLLWFVFSLMSFKNKDTASWSKMMFQYSLVVIMLFAVTLSCSILLP